MLGDARRIEVIQTLTPEIEAMAGGANAEAGVGSGGMATKLMASISGVRVWITSIRRASGLRRGSAV